MSVQNKQLDELAINKEDIEFYYEDFRQGWQEGVKVSKEMGLYRQKYCGCVFSERERHNKLISNVKA